MSTSPPVCAVLGAGGFIGRHVTRALAETGSVVWAVSREDQSFDGPKDKNIRAVRMDLAGEEPLVAFLAREKPQIVVNSAVYGTVASRREDGPSFRINVMMPLAAFRAAASAGARRFVQLGTCEEYGRHDHPIGEETLPNPEGPYATSKASATALLRALSQQTGTGLLVVRPFGTWGMGEAPHRLAPAIVRGVAEQKLIPMSDGAQLRDFSLVEDVAQAITQLALDNGPDGGVILNVASGKPRSVRDFALMIADSIGGRDLIQFGAVPRRPNEMPAMLADNKLLLSRLGWVPRDFSPDVVRAMLSAYKAERSIEAKAKDV